mgnify:CR=1 FL=1
MAIKRLCIFFSVFLAISICFMFSVTAFAQFLYINEPEMNSYLSISEGKATMYSGVTADSNVTKIVITHVLQKDGKDVPGTSRTQTFYKSNAGKQNTVNCTGSGSYQIKTTYKITSPSETDTHTKYSNTESIYYPFLILTEENWSMPPGERPEDILSKGSLFFLVILPHPQQSLYGTFHHKQLTSSSLSNKASNRLRRLDLAGCASGKKHSSTESWNSW